MNPTVYKTSPPNFLPPRSTSHPPILSSSPSPPTLSSQLNGTNHQQTSIKPSRTFSRRFWRLGCRCFVRLGRRKKRRKDGQGLRSWGSVSFRAFWFRRVRWAGEEKKTRIGWIGYGDQKGYLAVQTDLRGFLLVRQIKPSQPHPLFQPQQPKLSFFSTRPTLVSAYFS